MNRTLLKLSTLSLVIVSLSACNSASDDVNNYTGTTSPAYLSSAAVANLFVDNYQASTYGLTASDLTGVRITSTRASLTRSATVKVSRPVDDTYYGECGGYIDYRGRYDDDTDYIDVTATANNYCNYDETFNGFFALEGYSYDLRVDFENFDYRDDYYNLSFTLNGQTRFEDNYPIYGTTSNMVIDDYQLNQTYMLRNWSELVDARIDPEGVFISGEIYDSTFGYVEVTTLEPIVPDGEGQTGQIVLFGEDSIAWITFYSSGYLVEVDVNDDGFIDDDDLYTYIY